MVATGAMVVTAAADNGPDTTVNKTTIDTEFIGTVADEGTVTVKASGVTDNGSLVNGEVTVTVGGQPVTAATADNGSVTVDIDPSVLDLAPTPNATVGLAGFDVADPATVEIVHEAFGVGAGFDLRSVPQGAAVSAEGVSSVNIWNATAGTYDTVTDPVFGTAAADLHRGLYVTGTSDDARVGYTFANTVNFGTVELSTGWNFASSNFNISQTTNLTVEEDLDLVSGNVSDLEIYSADFNQQLNPNDIINAYDGYWVFVDEGDQPVVRNLTSPAYDRGAREEVLQTAEGELSFSDQATASSTFTREAPTAPGVVVDSVETNTDSAVVVTYEDSGDLVIAGLETFNATNLDGGSVTIPVDDTGGFPGTHTAHVIPTAELSGAYEPGNTVSFETADAILDSETATVFQGTVEFQNQTASDVITENDTLATLETADLLGSDDTAFTVNVHPTDDDGNLVGTEFVGSSDVLTGANENVTVTAEQVPDNGNFNEFPLNETDGYVATIHTVNDGASPGDPASPGEYPMLPNADAADEFVPGGVTDGGEVAIASGQIEGTVTASGDTPNTDQAAGEPITGANVTLYAGNNTDPVDEVAIKTTDSAGAYDFTGLSAGNYTVEVTADNFASASDSTAVSGSQTRAVDFALDYAEAGAVSGEITLNKVDPDEDVNVTVTIAETGNATTVTLAGGTATAAYTIPDIDVDVGDGYTVTAASDSPNYDDPADATNVTVDVGATTTGVNFGLTRQTGSLGGTVLTNDTGSPIEDATVEVSAFGSSGPVVETTTTDASGEYSIGLLPVGEHTVTVSVNGSVAGERSAIINANETTTVDFAFSATTFTVDIGGALVGAAGETQTADITVENTGDLPGEQTINLDWGGGAYTNSTTVGLADGASTTVPLSVTTDATQALGIYNVTATSADDSDEVNATLGPGRTLNQTVVEPGGTVNVTVTGQVGESGIVSFADEWSPPVNGSEIISTSFTKGVLGGGSPNDVILISDGAVSTGPLEIVYEIAVPADADGGTVYEWEPAQDGDGSFLQVGDENFPIFGDQSFEIELVSPVDDVLLDSVSNLLNASGQPLVDDSITAIEAESTASNTDADGDGDAVSYPSDVDIPVAAIDDNVVGITGPFVTDDTGFESFSNEEFLLNVYDDLLGGSGTILHDEGHGQFYDRDSVGTFANYAESNGYTYDSTTNIQNATGTADAFVITTPSEAFSQSELDALSTFVDNGGVLFLHDQSDFDNFDATDNHNAIASAVNASFRFNDDQVVDDTNNGGAPFLPVTGNFNEADFPGLFDERPGIGDGSPGERSSRTVAQLAFSSA